MRVKMLRFLAAEIRHQPCDLARQLHAHIIVDVVREMTIGVRRGARIGGNGAAGGDCTVLREIMQDIVAGVCLAGQFVLGGLGALFQKRENFLARHVALWRGNAAFCPLLGISVP